MCSSARWRDRESAPRTHPPHPTPAPDLASMIDLAKIADIALLTVDGS
jgi:hypothetical protein